MKKKGTTIQNQTTKCSPRRSHPLTFYSFDRRPNIEYSHRETRVETTERANQFNLNQPETDAGAKFLVSSLTVDSVPR